MNVLRCQLKMAKADKPIRVVRYEPQYKAQWDDFVQQSKNGTFLFHRDYMDYHADRFPDFSFLLFEDDELVALMPATRSGETAMSHAGLTFGGVISGKSMTIGRMLAVFTTLIDELRSQEIKRLIYKAIPHMYHRIPAEEDLYALFVHEARLFRRDVSSTIFPARGLPLVRSRRKSSQQAKVMGLEVEQTRNFSQFMAIAEASLQSRHGLSTVHSAAEMELLASRFPNNIKLFAVNQGKDMLGGVIIYESENVAHGQYRHATEEGMRVGALDYLLDTLIHDIYAHKPWLDFGISMTRDGQKLNLKLAQNKESFGARTTVYDFYELNLENKPSI